MRPSTLILALLPIAIAACSSTPVEPARGPAATAAETPRATSPVPSGQASAAPSRTVTPAHLDPSSPISANRSVFFDYDEFSIRQKYVPLIERQGSYLAANPSLSIKIEGSSDERGSAEYNLALGQKRAQAVFAALKVYGVRDSQMEALSWGEEKPKATGHDEGAWSQNRRADIVYRQ
jgi:peptidoglycan-associated lipoprotein